MEIKAILPVKIDLGGQSYFKNPETNGIEKYFDDKNIILSNKQDYYQMQMILPLVKQRKQINLSN